jgi:hypothetical protein
VAHPEVGDRPDVEPAQLEDEEHLRRPGADAAHARQRADDLVVGLAGQGARRQDERPVECLRREVAQRADFGTRQADGPQRLVGQREQPLGRDVAVQRRDQPAVDGPGRGARELLVDDRLDQRLEGDIARRAIRIGPASATRPASTGSRTATTSVALP